MKILAISNVFPPGFIGGYELAALEILQRLTAKGHLISVLTSDYFRDDENAISGISVERSLECKALSHERHIAGAHLREDAFLNWGNIRKIGSAIRREKPDLVFLFNTGGLGNVALYQYLKATSVSTITCLMDNIFAKAHEHSSEWQKYEGIFGPLKAEDLGRVFTVSDTLMHEFERVVPGIGKIIDFVPCFIDPSLFPAAHGGDRETGIPPKGRRFVFCSRVTPHKGTVVLLDAVEKLARRGITDFSVDVFGAGQVTHFQQEVTRRQLDGCIRYMGVFPRSEMIAKYRDYDALLFPTWEREPFGFVVCEAAASGCVPIMTAAMGASEWYLDGIDCLKIDRTSDGLMQAMLQFICLSDPDLAKIRQAAIDNTCRNLSIDRWINVIEEICLAAVEDGLPVAYDQLSRVESAFLVLKEIWRDI